LPEERHAFHSAIIAAVKIAVVGAGAMGSVYAGLLGAAGNEVWAVDLWQEHVDAIRERGLRVEGASGDRTVRIHATTEASEAGEAELVILATKAMDVEAAAEAARPLVGPDTVVLSIQNGLGGPEIASRVLGEIAIGVAGGFGASIVAPGHVHHHGLELIRLGPGIEHVAEVWRAAGFNVRTFDDIQRLVWEKLICNVAMSGPCTVLRQTIREVLEDADAWAVSAACASEAYAVGRAAGVSFGFDDPVAYVHAWAAKIPGAKPSMLLDLEAGRRLEIDYINGAIPRVGAQVGVETPVNYAVTALVKGLTAAR
jgi:2-dehydropantoate 2-reductase